MFSILVSQLVRRVAEREVKRLNPERFRYLIETLEPWPDAPRKWILEAYERAFSAALDAIDHVVAAGDPDRLERIKEEIEVYLGHEFALIAMLLAADMAKRFGAWGVVMRAMSLTASKMQDIIDLRAKEENWRLIKAVKEAERRFRDDDVVEYVLNGVKLGRVVKEKIKGNPLIDMRLTIQLSGFRATLTMSEEAMKEAWARGNYKKLWGLAAEVGRQVVDAAWAVGGSISEIEERAYALAIIARRHVPCRGTWQVYEGMWYGVAEEIYLSLLGGR